MAVRADTTRRRKVGIERAEKHFTSTSLAEEGRNNSIAAISGPLEGRNSYDDSAMRRHVELVVVMDVCGGDFA